MKEEDGRGEVGGGLRLVERGGEGRGGGEVILPVKSFITVNGITMMQTKRSVIARERRK